MQEADRRVDHDVAGEEHFFAAGTVYAFSHCSARHLKRS
jgi:hypothetical protein